MRGIRFVLLYLACLLGLAFMPTLLTGQATNREISNGSYVGARDTSVCEWRNVPKAVPSSLPPEQEQLLTVRSKASDSLSPYGPLDQRSTSAISVGHSGARPPRRDEIPFFPNETIVVATLTDYQVFLTLSHRSIFTIGNLTVSQTIESGDQNVSDGQQIDLWLPGGAVMLTSGRTISYFTESGDTPLGCMVQPNHKYILFLQYMKDEQAVYAFKVWDVTTGVVVPASWDDVERAKSGISKLAGMTESDAVDAIRKAVSLRNQQKSAN